MREALKLPIAALLQRLALRATEKRHQCARS